MSEVFECAIVAAPKNAVVIQLQGMDDLAEKYAVEVERIGDFSIVYWGFSYRREFDSFGEQICASLSHHFGRAVLVRYDSGTCYRFSSLFRNGIQERLFQLADEKWVVLDAEGYPDPSQGVFLTHEMVKAEEYETIENAVQLGLKEIGFADWKLLLGMMAGR